MQQRLPIVLARRRAYTRSLGRDTSADWTRSTWADQDKSEAKHPVAVARSLQWADEAAERGDHSDALAWLHVIEAIGDELPETYQTKRHAWLLAFGTDR